MPKGEAKITRTTVTTKTHKRSSILDAARENPLIAPRPMLNLDAESDAAIGEAMMEQNRRARAKT